MAVTKIHPITTTLSKALEYIQNPDKTDQKLLISGYGCTPEVAFFQFNQVKQNADKTDGTLAEHLIQSFAPGEVDYETAHKIGTELADKILKGRFQYVIATHIDREHIHNHIIWNSVSFKDNKKYHSTPNSYYVIQRTSDILCKENGLSIVEKSKNKGKSLYEHQLDKKGLSWKTKLRKTIDFCILKAKDWDEFLLLMKKEKYEIKPGKYISFRAEGQERFTRAKTLGDDYTEDNIKKRINGEYVRNTSDDKTDIAHNVIIDIENNIKAQQSVGYRKWANKYNLKLVSATINYLSENDLLESGKLDEKISDMEKRYADKKNRIREIEKKLKVLEELMNDVNVYRKTKSVVDGAPKHFGIEKYKSEHEAEFILFAAAKKAIRKYYDDGNVPPVKDIKNEIKDLRDERDKIKKDVYTEKTQIDELKNMKKNVGMFMGSEEKQKHNLPKTNSKEIE